LKLIRIKNTVLSKKGILQDAFFVVSEIFSFRLRDLNARKLTISNVGSCERFNNSFVKYFVRFFPISLRILMLFVKHC